MTSITSIDITDRSTGEVIGPDVGAALTADDAAAQLPLVASAITHLRRVEGYLREVVADEMRRAGQTERRAGEQIYELKGDVSWVVADPGELFRALVDASSHGQITRAELDEAVQQVVEFAFHHGVLNRLAKRVPAIDGLRQRVEGEPKLRQKR